MFSYITKGKLKNLDAKEIGKETYPPNPNIKFGFSFFKIRIDFTIDVKIKKIEKNFFNKFLFVGVPAFNMYDLNSEWFLKS